MPFSCHLHHTSQHVHLDENDKSAVIQIVSGLFLVLRQTWLLIELEAVEEKL